MMTFCLRFLLFFIVLPAVLSCSHLKTPQYNSKIDYVPQGEYATPNELYQSKEILKDAVALPEEEFSLHSPVKDLVITQGFSPSGVKSHQGLDIRGRRGDTIYAAHDGTVIYAGSKFHGYGRMIILEFNSNWATLYGHLNKIKVKMGAKIKAGTIIGSMGRTGRATGVHLHFELMHKKIPVDPEPLLNLGKTVTRYKNDIRLKSTAQSTVNSQKREPKLLR